MGVPSWRAEADAYVDGLVAAHVDVPIPDAAVRLMRQLAERARVRTVEQVAA